MLKTKRWNDPVEKDDGFRLLITRYRPRGVSKQEETWDAWNPDLGPSRDLHADYWAKHGRTGIPWTVYRTRYLREMRQQKEAIRALAGRVAAGETITLLCSSACVRESRCHRSLLKELIEAETTADGGKESAGPSEAPATKSSSR